MRAIGQFYNSFDSKLVRLKVKCSGNLFLTQFRFDSKLVRLKGQ